ncbi:MAG: PHP-associated domain-containing protein [Candidatus Methanomethylophilaceae archaeon]
MSDQHGKCQRVQFGKPDWNAMAEEGLLCADMHFHTHYSDSYTSVSRTIDLAKKRKVCFAITDHNLIAGVEEAYMTDPGIMIIPGIEISSWDGPHILVYFYDLGTLREYWTKNIKPNLSKSPWLAIQKDTEWILDSLEGENCLISAAHPMGYLLFNKGVQKCINKGYLAPSVTERIDAYEVICSGMTRASNLAALASASKFGLGYTGGTDGHMMREVGNVVSVSDAGDMDGFLDDIKRRRNTVIGMEKTSLAKLAMGTATFSRYLPHVPSSMKVHYRQNIGRDSAYRRK